MSKILDSLVQLADEIRDELFGYQQTLHSLRSVEVTPDDQYRVEAEESKLRGMFDQASELMQQCEAELGADDAEYREVRSQLMDDFRSLNISCKAYVEDRDRGFERTREPEPEPKQEQEPSPEPEQEPEEELEFLDEESGDPEIRKKAKAQREKARQEQYARQAKEAEDRARAEAQQKYDAEAERRRAEAAPSVGYDGPQYGYDYDNPRRDEAPAYQPEQPKPKSYDDNDILYCPEPVTDAAQQRPSVQELLESQRQREASYEDAIQAAYSGRDGKPSEDAAAYGPTDPYLSRPAEDILREARQEVHVDAPSPDAMPDYAAAGMYQGNVAVPETLPDPREYGGRQAGAFIPSPPMQEPQQDAGSGHYVVFTEKQKDAAAVSAPGASVVDDVSGRSGTSAFGLSGGSTVTSPSGIAFVAVNPAVAAAMASTLNNPTMPRVHAAFGSTVYERVGNNVGHEVKTDGYQVSRAVTGVMAMDSILQMKQGVDMGELRRTIEAARYVAPSLDTQSLDRVNSAIQAVSGGKLQGFSAKDYKPAEGRGIHLNNRAVDLAMGTSAEFRKTARRAVDPGLRDGSAFTTFMEGTKTDTVGGAVADSRVASVAKAMEGFAHSRAANSALQAAGSVKGMIVSAMTQGDYRENSMAVLRDGINMTAPLTGIMAGAEASHAAHRNSSVAAVARRTTRLEQNLYGNKSWSKLSEGEFKTALKEQGKTVRELQAKLEKAGSAEKVAITQELRKAKAELREMHNFRDLHRDSAGAVEAAKVIEKYKHLGHVSLKGAQADVKNSIEKFHEMLKDKKFSEMQAAYGKHNLAKALNNRDSKIVAKIEADMEAMAAAQRAVRNEGNAAIRAVPKAELSKFMKNKKAMAALQSKMAKGAALSKLEKAAAAKLRVMGNAGKYHSRAVYLEALQKTKSLSKNAGKTLSNIRKSRLMKKRTLNSAVSMMGRALAKGDDYLLGASTAMNIGSNPFVHKGVKTAYKGSRLLVRVTGKVAFWTVKGGVWLVGGNPAVASLNTHVNAAKSTVAAAKQVVRNVPASAMRAAVNGASFAGRNAARLFEKSAPKTAGAIKDGVNGTKKAVGAVKKGIKKVGNKIGNTAAAKAAKATKAAVSKAAQAVQKLTAAIGKVISFIGAALTWLIIIYFILLGIVLALTSSFGGGSSTSDGKLDLSEYDAVITAEWSGYLDEMRNNLADDYDCERIRTFDIDSIAPNKKEILTMLSVRAQQDLDTVGRGNWEPYLKYLTKQLNPYDATVDIEYCSGCYCDGHEDDEGNIDYCSGCCCDGHRVLDVTLRPWVFDIANVDTDPTLKLSNGSTRKDVSSVDGYTGTVNSAFTGWNDDNLDLAIMIYSQDWTTLYVGIDSISAVEGHGFDLTDIVFEVDPDRPGDSTVPDYALQFLGEGGYRFYTYLGWTYKVPWCATFTSYCFEQIDPGFLPNRGFSSCGQFIQWGIDNHLYTPQGSGYKPVAGDIIFFDWEPDGQQDHVGIVCGTDSEYVYTVEGNSGDLVKTKRYSLTSNCIFGYIAVP